MRQAEELESGEPVTLDDVKNRLQQVARDDRLWDPAALAGDGEVAQLPAIPDPDPVLDAATIVLHDHVDRALRRALDEELEDAWATAPSGAGFDALHALDSDSSGD